MEVYAGCSAEILVVLNSYCITMISIIE